MRRELPILLAAVLAWVTPAAAGWREILPRAFENGAYLELFGAHERDASRNAGRPFDWSDTFFREKITLFSNGYFYDPRFLTYDLSVGGALKQENYSLSSAPSTGWTHNTGTEYDGKFLFLPEHPYNLELFAFRREPLYKEQASTQHGSVLTSHGAHFRYRRKPLFFHAGYLDNTTESRLTTTNVQRLGFEGEYFRRFTGGTEVAVTGSYAPSQFSGNLGLSGSSTLYGLTGLVNAGWVRSYLSATKNLYDQDSGPSGTLDNNQFAFQERLNVELPLHFKTDFYYRILDNQSTTFGPGEPAGRELSDTATDFQAILSHRLFQSLDSRYIFQQGDRTSTGGESSFRSNTLGLDYSKRISRGRILAGGSYSRSVTDNTGRTDIVSEPHLATPVPGSFSLGQPNVDPATLAVFLRSPVPPQNLILLVENVHYSVTSVAGVLQVFVFPDPPGVPPQPAYDLFVSFSLVTGNFELETNTSEFDASVQLFDELLTPHYRYVAVRSDVLSGVFPGDPLDSTSNTVGLTFRRERWRALTEYQTLDWASSPYRSWRQEVQYIAALDPTLRIYAMGTYLNIYYPHGSSAAVPAPYTDETLTASGSLQKDLLSRSLLLSAGGSYTRTLGFVDSNAYALSASVIWRIGKLDLNAGADVYGSDTQSDAAVAYSRAHQYYYVRLRRRLF